MALVREFRLSPQGVSCDGNGAFLGTIPLLKRSHANGQDRWQPIDGEQLCEQISAQFGLPVDKSRKMGGLTAIAEALNAGDIARAQIATVLLGIPDPPPFAKDDPSRDAISKFIRDLHWSGMIRWDDDESLPSCDPAAVSTSRRQDLAKAGFCLVAPHPSKSGLAFKGQF